MRSVEDRFRSQLVADESVEALTSGRLLEDVVRGRATIGLTDRRLRCLSETGEFVDVRYEYICSIRSRNRTRVEYRSGPGPNRTLRLAGGFAALALLIAGLVVTASIDPAHAALSVALAAVTVPVIVGVESLRTRSGIGRSSDQIALGAGVLALLGFVGAGLVAATISFPLYALVTLGGLGLAGYAVRYREEFDGLGVDNHRETLLSINTIDGETVRLVVDADSAFERELCACVHRRDESTVDIPVVQTPSD